MTAYISEDGRTLRFGNESSSNWTESVVQTETDFNFFIGVDLIEYAANEPLILAAENKIAYLAAYTTHTLPSLLEAFAQSVAIRTAAIITWPTPTEGAIRQIIQSNSDLSNLEGGMIYRAIPSTIRKTATQLKPLLRLKGIVNSTVLSMYLSKHAQKIHTVRTHK